MSGTPSSPSTTPNSSPTSSAGPPAASSPNGTNSGTPTFPTDPSGPLFPQPSLTSSSDPNASTSTQSSPGLGPPSSSLYLFTFLATLFLLLAISSAIIMRGIFLRRRFRRRIEEAIAAGVLLSPSDDGSGGFGGRAYRRKLQRPTLFDVSVLPPYFSTSSPHEACWEKTMPFAGSISSETAEAKTAFALETDSASSLNPPIVGRRPGIRAVFADAFEAASYVLPRNRNRNRILAAAQTQAASAMASAGDGADGDHTSPAIPLEPQDPVRRAAEVRVAVMVAMPNPHRSAYVPPTVDAELQSSNAGGKGKARGLDGWGEDGEEEAGVPDVVFGLAKVALERSPPAVVQTES